MGTEKSISSNTTTRLGPLRRYGDPSLKRPQAYHPHSGAVDEYGNFGYVHDPAILNKQKNTSNFATSHEDLTQLCAPVGEGPEGGNAIGRELFGQHIKVSQSPPISSINVFCAIYTYPGNKNQTNAIKNTWGRRCDGIMFASTETVHEDATVHLLHNGGHQGMYRGIWQKVRSMLSYIYDNFLEDFDYFLLSGDDTYVILENLRMFLTSPKVMEHAAGGSQYFYTGSWIHPFWLLKKGYTNDFYYMGGGAGYVLSRAAVRGLVELAWPTCKNTTIDSAEDVFMAECLQQYLNVTGYDSRDGQGRERFISYDPIKLVSMQMSSMESSGIANSQAKKQHPKVDKRSDREKEWLGLRQQGIWRQMKHNWTQQYGLEYVSSTAISFHMVQPAIKMHRYEQLFYHLRSNETFDEDLFLCGNVSAV
ncbi:MAG: hypothetical protein SGILL_009457 [Bacillariaceae sp.]